MTVFYDYCRITSEMTSHFDGQRLFYIARKYQTSCIVEQAHKDTYCYK